MTLRRARAVLVLAIAVAALAVGLALRARTPAPSGPVLVVRATGPDAGAPAPRADSEERAMALAAAAMSPADRHRILEMVDFATARLEARLSPLGTDFEDGDPVAQLRASLAPFMPSFTAARELERGAWQSDDLQVRVAASCIAARPAADERCIPLWAEGATAREDGRARFLAWAASHARVVHLATRARAEACARDLRVRASLESSPIALVLLDDDLALHGTPDRAGLQAAANRLGRAMAANDRHDTKDLEAFARAVKEEPVAPWLTLSRTELVVVPRLSALGRELAVDCPVQP